jgi:hypothetical protein
MVIAAFFIIVKGIEFGNEKVLKWLTSFIISVVTSIFLTEPIKVLKFFHFLLTTKKGKVLKILLKDSYCVNILCGYLSSI